MTLLDQIDELIVAYKHLQGQHDQRTHGVRGGGVGQGANEPAESTTRVEPWAITFAELEAFRVPTPMGDKSRNPFDVSELRDEMGTLYDYRGDDYAVADWLGKGYDKRHDMSYMASAVKNNAPMRIYRATDAENEIFPGAYVTLSKNYAHDHGERNMGGSNYKVLEGIARPDELVAMNPNEFFFAPKDLKAWHKSMVEKAVRNGKIVPDKVLAEYPELKPR